MELFSIQCTTCRVRLKVKDVAVIGTILNCPKCSSMVEVVPPVGWQQPGSETVADASDRADSTGPSPAAAATERVATPVASADSAGPTSKSPPPALPSRREPEAAASKAASAVESPSPAGAMTLHPDPTPPKVAWHGVLLAHVKRDWPMVTGGLAAGAVLGATAWFVLGFGSDAPESVADARSRTEIATARPEVPGTEIGSALQPEPPLPTDVDPALAAEPAAAQRIAQPSIGPDAAPAADKLPAKTAVAAAPVAPSAADSPAPKEPVAAAPSLEPKSATLRAATPSIKLDPDPSSSGPPNPFDLSGPGIAAPASLGESLDGSLADDTPATHDSAEPPQTETLSADAVEDRMSVMLGEVNFVGVPLAQFVDFVAEVTTLSIVIDDTALAAAGKRRSMQVTVHLNETTAQEALRAALAPLGLTYQVRGNRLFITVARRGARQGR